MGAGGGLQTSSSAISKSEHSCAFPVALAAGEFLALTLYQLPGSLGRCRWAPEAVRAASQGKEPSFVILGKVSWTPGRARVSFPTLPLVYCLACEALLASLRRMSEDVSAGKSTNWESHELRANPTSATLQPCDVGEVTQVLKGS